MCVFVGDRAMGKGSARCPLISFVPMVLLVMLSCHFLLHLSHPWASCLEREGSLEVWGWQRGTWL